MEGQRSMRRIRKRTSGLFLLFSMIAGTLYLALKISADLFVNDKACGTSSKPTRHALTAVLALLFSIRYIALNLAPLADDVILMRCVIVANSLLEIPDCILIFRSPNTHAASKWMMLGTSIFVWVWSVWPMIGKSAAAIQARLWPLLVGFLAVITSASAIRTAYVAFMCHTLSPAVWWFIILGITILVLCTARSRERLQALARRIGGVHGATTMSGASIAGLVGECPAKDILAEASIRFHCLDLGGLSFSDVADNTPDPGLFRRSSICNFGQCDAFISHSWHDDSIAKWEALQSWRRTFVAQHGREPRIWFDKGCLDQDDITRNLRCLPIFLTGCTKLVILCGTTYLERLWCVIELFTYLHAGGDIGRIDFLRVVHAGQAEADWSCITSAVDNFDARSCECFLSADLERMLAIISAAYGSLDVFNTTVQRIMRQLLAREAGYHKQSRCLGFTSIRKFVSEDTSTSSSSSSSPESDDEAQPANACTLL